MKIIQINSTCGTGSNGRLAFQIAEYVKDRGEKSFFCYAWGKDTFENTYRIGTFLEQKMHAVLSRITGLQGYFSKKATCKLLQYIDTVKPDVVHIHNLHSNYINLPLFFEYISKHHIGLVLTLHDCWYFTGKCVHPVYADCTKFQSVCKKCPQWKSDKINPTFFFDRSTKCQQDKFYWFHKIEYDKICIVGVSKWITNEAKKSRVFSDRDCCTIYNWIDSNQFYFDIDANVCQKYSIPSGKKIVLMVSSQLSNRKGFLELCYLSSMLPEDYQMVFVGDKGKLSLPNNVVHVPKTESIKELRNIYSIASVCVNLSYGETFGMVTVESLSCGTPVIVYDNTASPELVGPGCGIVIEQLAGYDNVLDAVVKICRNPKSYYKDNCMQFVRDNFEKNKSLEAYYNVYLKLAKNG